MKIFVLPAEIAIFAMKMGSSSAIFMAIYYGNVFLKQPIFFLLVLHSHHFPSVFPSPPPAVLQKAERTLVEAGFAAAAIGLQGIPLRFFAS